MADFVGPPDKEGYASLAETYGLVRPRVGPRGGGMAPEPEAAPEAVPDPRVRIVQTDRGPVKVRSGDPLGQRLFGVPGKELAARLVPGVASMGLTEVWGLLDGVTGKSERDLDAKSKAEHDRTAPARAKEGLFRELDKMTPQARADALMSMMSANPVVDADGNPRAADSAIWAQEYKNAKGYGAVPTKADGSGPMGTGGSGGGGGGGGGGGAAPPGQPGLVRVGASESVQGQVPIPKEVYDLYGGAAEHALASGVSKAQAEAQAAQAQAQAAAATQVVGSEMQKRRMAAEAVRLDEVDEAMMDMEDSLERQRGMKIDPDGYMNSKSGWGKVSTALALAMTTLGSGITGQANVGLTLIQQGIQNSIDAQKAQIELAGKDVAGQKTLYAQMLQKHGDERTAEKATEISLLGMVKLEYEKKLALAQDPAIRANLEAGISQIQESLAGRMTELAKLHYGSRSRGEQYALPRPTGGGGGGGAKKKPENAHWLAGEFDKIDPYRLAYADTVQKMKLFEKKHPGGLVNGLDPFSKSARAFRDLSPAHAWLWRKAFGDDAEELLQSALTTTDKQLRLDSGAVRTPEEVKHQLDMNFGTRGFRGLQSGMATQGGSLRQRYANLAAADADQARILREGHAGQGTKFDEPEQYVPALAAED